MTPKTTLHADPRPLASLKDGDHADIHEIRGGHNLRQRLADMGLLAGTGITVIKSGGPAILEVRGHRIVIGRGMIHKILVRPQS